MSSSGAGSRLYDERTPRAGTTRDACQDRRDTCRPPACREGVIGPLQLAGSLSSHSSKVGPREIGHLHGDRAAHFSFPKQVWGELKEQGRIVNHPVFPGRVGPAARRIDGEDDVRDVIELLRLNYDRVVARYGA